jgi:hypothetical protein
MSRVEDRVARALRARAEEVVMSQDSMQRNHMELMERTEEARAPKSRLLAVAAAIVVLVAAVGVGLWATLGGDDEAATVPAGPSAGEERAAALLSEGYLEFTRTVTAGDQAAAGAVDLEAGGWPTGEVMLTMSGAGNLKVAYDGPEWSGLAVKVLDDGTWKVGPSNQGGYCQQTGTYRATATADGSALTLTAIAEPANCVSRQAALVGTWAAN